MFTEFAGIAVPFEVPFPIGIGVTVDSFDGGPATTKGGRVGGWSITVGCCWEVEGVTGGM